MNGFEAEPAGAIARSRRLFEALGDERGVHLCDLALAEQERDPVKALEALLPALERLVQTGTLTGMDVVASTILLAARKLGASDLEAMARNLVVHSRSLELRVLVLNHLWGASFEALDRAEPRASVAAALAALELAVACGDFEAAAVSLIHLGTAHEAANEREAARLCLAQAARYLRRAGRPDAAATLWLEVAQGGPSERAMALREAALCLEGSDADGAATCWIDLAESLVSTAALREAVRVLNRALGIVKDPQVEVRAWRALAAVHRRLGDPNAACACDARASLLAEAIQEE